MNVHDCNNGISGIHGKELPEQMSIHRKYNRSHTQKMFDISTRLVSEQDEIWIGNNWLGKSFIEIPVIDW